MADAGLFFVTSKVKDPSKLSDELFNRFYNDEHIPDLHKFFKAKGGITKPLALRCRNTRRDSDKPYLALYPIPDAQWMFSPDQAEFQEQSKRSGVLGVDNIWEYIDFGFRPYEKPRCLALHEYDCEPKDLPTEHIAQVTETEWTQKILKESPIFDRDVFVLIGAFGEMAAKL